MGDPLTRRTILGMDYWAQVAFHEARGLSRPVAMRAARIVEARSTLKRWDEMLHPRGRVGQFIETDENGNPREPVGGGGFVGSRLPAMTPKQLNKMLRKAGFTFVHQKGSHAVFEPPGGGRKVVVPMHGSHSIPRGTLKNILATAGA